MFRSKRIRTGRDEVAVLEAEADERENKLLSREFKMWSLSLRSSFCAIVAAALSLGQRMIGI